MYIHPFVTGIMFTFLVLVVFGCLWVLFFGGKKEETAETIVQINEADEETIAALIKLGYLYEDESGIHVSE